MKKLFNQYCSRTIVVVVFFSAIAFFVHNKFASAIVEPVNSGKLHLELFKTIRTQHAVNRLAWHPNNKELATGQNLNRKISILSIDSNKVARTLADQPGGVEVLAYTPDGKNLVVGRNFSARTEYNINIYSVETGNVVHKFKPPKANDGAANNDATALAISPDSRYLVARGFGGGATAVVYNISSREVIAELKSSAKPTEAIQSLDWSPNGQWIALGRINGKLELWRAGSWKLEKERELSSRMIGAITFSSDSRSLALGSFSDEARGEPDIFVLDSTSLSVVRAIASNHRGSSIKELAFTPDTKFLISGANAVSVAIHHVSSGAEALVIKDIKPNAHPVLSRDGSVIAVGSGNEVRLYKIKR